MGWFGYGIYDGDETQTRHITFLKWAKIEHDSDVIFDNYFIEDKTILPKDKLLLFQKNISFILKRITKPSKWDEDSAIEWQMLLALFVDNKLKAPAKIYENGVSATIHLMEYADDFDNPSKRKKALKKFIDTADKYNKKLSNR